LIPVCSTNPQLNGENGTGAQPPPRFVLAGPRRGEKASEAAADLKSDRDRHPQEGGRDDGVAWITALVLAGKQLSQLPLQFGRAAVRFGGGVGFHRGSVVVAE